MQTSDRIVLLPEDEEVQVRLTDRGPELVFVDVEGVERVVRVPMRDQKVAA